MWGSVGVHLRAGDGYGVGREKDGVVIVEMFHIVARPYEVKGDGVE
jgi:hypothetical protein